MTGSRLSFRRYSGCNLHWYTPRRVERTARTTYDCGWDWLARSTPHPVPGALFARLCDHVHTHHDNPSRRYVFLPVLKAAVRLSHSRRLDTRLETDVFPDSTEYEIRVRFPYLTTQQTGSLSRAAGSASRFSAADGVDAPRTPPRARHPLYTKASWRVRASNPTLAQREAQEQVRSVGLLGGSAWETPTPVYTTKN